MPVVLVDLRNTEVRDRLRKSPVGDIAVGLYPAATNGRVGAMADVPMRLIVVLPIDAKLVEDAERLALALLGSDPQPRTIVAALNGTIEDQPERDASSSTRILPNEFGRHPDVRFLDLRASMLSVGHPRTGTHQVGTGPRDPWVREFVRDLLVQLQDREVFDAVWHSIPLDQPATVGMRLAALGAGRERAVADLALRLSEELRPDREPEMGRALPERWSVDEGLLPSAAIRRNDPPTLPPAVIGLADASKEGILKVLRRPPEVYNRAAESDIRLLTDTPARLAELFEAAEGRRGEPDGPWIDPLGAAALDEALGGVVFGDPVALQAEESADAADRVGDLLKRSARGQADGISAAVLANWLRKDADRVQPMGPARVAAILRGDDRPWASLRAFISQDGQTVAPMGGRQWVNGALQERLLVGSDGKSEAKDPPSDEAPDASDAVTFGTVEPWRVPLGLGTVLGSPIWRNRAVGVLYFTLTAIVVVLGIAQLWADRTGNYLISAADLGVDNTTVSIARIVIFVTAFLMVAYLVVSLIVAWAVRRWANTFRFAEVPQTLAGLDTDARRFATTEVARCAIRRDYARVARAAADALETATTRGSEEAKAFGQATEASAANSGPRTPGDVSPHRELLGVTGSLAGTDAGGIYRIYPMYVNALRRLFAQDLVAAVQEKWPRIRGVFWMETVSEITTMTSHALASRLERVLASGIQRGDLLRDGIEPADELAELLWADPGIRDAALRALHFEPDQGMPMLATPADNRMLDGNSLGGLILAVPATLEPLVRDNAAKTGASVIVTNGLETATAIRVFPFQPGLYDFIDFSNVGQRSAT